MFDAAPACPAHPLMQDPAFAAALKLCGQKPVKLPGGLIVLQRRIAGVPLVMLPRAIPPPDLMDQLARVGLHRRPVILSPERPCQITRAIRLAGPRVRAVLDLSDNETARRARLHPKWRNQLANAERRPVTVRRSRLQADLSHRVLTIETAQARTRGYANWPARLTASFARVAPKQTHLFEAISENGIVAHMLFLSHGSSASYHIGHITPRGKALCAHNLLLWEAGRHLAHLGCQSLDLGRLDPRTPGLDRFKLRGGAQRQETGGTYLIWHPLAKA